MTGFRGCCCFCLLSGTRVSLLTVGTRCLLLFVGIALHSSSLLVALRVCLSVFLSLVAAVVVRSEEEVSCCCIIFSAVVVVVDR